MRQARSCHHAGAYFAPPSDCPETAKKLTLASRFGSRNPYDLFAPSNAYPSASQRASAGLVLNQLFSLRCTKAKHSSGPSEHISSSFHRSPCTLGRCDFQGSFPHTHTDSDLKHKGGKSHKTSIATFEHAQSDHLRFESACHPRHGRRRRRPPLRPSDMQFPFPH